MRINKQKGITLVALVVTIIVLLILAGVSINQITKDNGIFSKVNEAKEKNNMNAAREKLELKLTEMKIDAVKDGKKLELIDLIKINQEETMKVITTTKDNEGNEIEETVKITEDGENKYAQVIVDGYLFKVNEDMSIESLMKIEDGEQGGEGGIIQDPEREEGYIEDEEIKDSFSNGKIVEDKDVVIDENSNKTNIQAVPNGWTGIYTEQDLINIKDNLKGKYLLMADISLKNQWTPLGTNETPFEGYLNGNGYTINNLKISGDTGYIGLFGKTAGGARISNLNLTNYVITGKGNFIGGLVGYNNANIKNVYATGKITLTGESKYVGGLVGIHHYYSKTTTKIEQVYTGGTIVEYKYGEHVGGIAGTIQGYSSIYVGNTGIKNSYTSMTVSGAKQVGGIVGTINYANLENLYTLGKITASKTAGGIVATSNESSYAQNCYWVKELSTQSNSSLGTLKTISQLVQKLTYSNYDFTNIWDIEEGSTTAYLKNMIVPDEVTNIQQGLGTMLGSGTSADPYQIRTVEQLKSVSSNLSAYYKVMNDLDLGGISDWTPIGTEEEPFAGNFNGNGYTISNLKISAKNSYYEGLFGNIVKATISNLTIKNYNISVTGTTGAVGALAGGSGDSDITNVNTIGNICYGADAQYVGGLVGWFEAGTKTSTINRCYTEGKIRYSTLANTSSGYGGFIGGITRRNVRNSRNTL